MLIMLNLLYQRHKHLRRSYFLKKGRIKVHPILLNLEKFHASKTLITELRQNYVQFYIYFRMSIRPFDEIL